jgi:hypothetical protein
MLTTNVMHESLNNGMFSATYRSIIWRLLRMGEALYSQFAHTNAIS